MPKRGRTNGSSNRPRWSCSKATRTGARWPHTNPGPWSTRTEEVQVGKWTFTATLSATKCSACGESYINGGVLSRFELSAARKLAELGIREGTVFKFMRKALGMRAADLADLLSVTPETVSRWENDKNDVDLAAFVILGSLVADKLEGRTTTHDRLRAVHEPPKPKSQPIPVDVPVA